MGDGRTPGPMCQVKEPVSVQDGTRCLAATPAPGPAWSLTSSGSARRIALRDEDLCQSRLISSDSEEFRRNYIDNNIDSADYTSTAFASQEKQFRDFWVNYTDGRRLKFNLDDIPIRYKLTQRPGFVAVRLAFTPRMYIKRRGFIYPEFYGDGGTSKLIDIATTIVFNHRQREKFLEVAELTFQFAVILSAYATPPEMPASPGRGTRLPSMPRGQLGSKPLAVLVVGAETEAEFAYATQVARGGQRVVVVNPHMSEAAMAYQRSGGNFIKGPIESLPRQPAFNLIREDFPFPLGRAFPPTERFVAERLARLKPGGRWIVATESQEFITTLEAAAKRQGARAPTREVPPFHEAAPQSPHPRETSRFVMIIEKP